MKRLWPKASTSTIVYYLAAITILSVICNFWYKKGFNSSQEFNAETFSKTKIEEVKSIEILSDNILYQLPPSKYQSVLHSIGSLQAAKKAHDSDLPPAACSIHISLKNSHIVRFQTKKYDDEAEVIIIEIQKGSDIQHAENTYLAENICQKVLPENLGR